MTVDDRPAPEGGTMETKYFTADFFGFLKNLSKNNNREWFTENKPRYEASVQEPALRFIHDAGLKLKTLSPHLVADARPFGGSLSGSHGPSASPRTRARSRRRPGSHSR